MAKALLCETSATWLARQKYEEAESLYLNYLSTLSGKSTVSDKSPTSKKQKSKGTPASEKKPKSQLMNQMEEIRSNISDSLKRSPPVASTKRSIQPLDDNRSELDRLKKDVDKVIQDMNAFRVSIEARLKAIETAVNSHQNNPEANQEAAKSDMTKVEQDDDEIDLFGDDDEEDPEVERQRLERVKMYEAKKAKKPAVVAKSNLVLDVKPWDDETDMKALESCVRSIDMDGLLWGASKLVPVGYGIQKLQITCVIEDDKVCTDDLEEAITGFEDYIQSMDIVAFNKV